MGNIVKALGSGFDAVKSGLKAATSTKAGKVAVTGAGVGGGVALAGAGIGVGTNAALSGVSEGIDKITDKNPINGIVKAINPKATNDEAKGIGTLITVGLLIGIALLVVFVIIPKISKNKGGSKK